MSTTTKLNFNRLRVIAASSLILVIALMVTSFLLYYRVQNLQNSRPIVKAYGFYEFCEALAPVGGSVGLRVDRGTEPLTVSVTARSEAEFSRLKEFVASSMLTTAASVEIRFGDETFRYAPPAVP